MKKQQQYLCDMSNTLERTVEPTERVSNELNMQKEKNSDLFKNKETLQDLFDTQKAALADLIQEQ
jgi:hypothetical protein